MDAVITIQPQDLADIIRCKSEKCLIVDARTFCEYNTSHIINSVNVWSSKIRKKRLQQNSISVHDFLQQACHISLQEINFTEVVVYDQSATFPPSIPPDTFLYVLLLKLSSSFPKVYLLQGGFLEFQSQFYEMCEDSSQKSFLLTSFSQPCLAISNAGPTKILPFLFLGSQYDANNKQLLLEHNISYELNVSTTCPKPDFLQDSHFLRIAVNDNFSAKLLPHFEEAFSFIDKVREVGGRVLVHCLAGISRSPTVVISYVMKYLLLHYDEAYRYVKTRRPTISPNINFVGQLLEFDLHLFGNTALFRSHPDPLYLPLEHDTLQERPFSPSGSLLLKSSSSSCLGTTDEAGFPYPLNRSLPSLRISKSGPDVPSIHPHQCMLPGSSDLETILSSFGLGDRPRKSTSDKLPSTPLSRPCTPDFVFPMSENIGNYTKRLSSPTAHHDEHAFGSDSYCVASRIVKDNRETMECEGSTEDELTLVGSSSHLSDKVTDELTKEKLERQTSQDHVQTETTQGKINNFNEKTHTSIPVTMPSFEVSVKEENKPEAVRENKAAVDTDLSPLTEPGTNGEATEHQFEGNQKYENKVKRILPSGDNLRPDKSPGSCHLPPPKPSSQGQNLKKDVESSPTDSPFTEDGTLVTHPKLAKTPPSRKLEPSQLPRSHSSSETYLNTRRRLERQAASHSSGGTHTRKSFSSDEVGKGFQGTPGTPSASTPTSGGPPGPHKDSFTSPLDLARCDSWSTSGLGSEISDWDSLQEDAQSVLMEDTQGPFDAVFAEVFPGEAQSPTTAMSTLRRNSERRGKSEEGRGKKWELTKTLSLDAKGSNYHDSGRQLPGSSGKKNTISPEELSGSCPTPRPVSLPGVSGNYSLSDPSVNVDMGVDMEDSGEWQKEGVQIFNFPPLRQPKGSNLIEHPPVNPRTMGEDVKYIMTWYKIDSCSQPTRSMTPKLSPVTLQQNPSELFSAESDKEKEPLGEQCHSPSLHADESDTIANVRTSEKKVSGEKKCNVAKESCESSFDDKTKSQSNNCDKVESTSSKQHLSTETLTDSTETKSNPMVPRVKESTRKTDDKSVLQEKENNRRDEPFFGDRRHDCAGNNFFLERKLSRSEKSDTLHERWQKWDEEFKKKIRNIKKSVSLTSWDPSSNDEGEDTQEDTVHHGNMAGFHLAQELMQSMEDLLEREICDIKRQAKALSTRFGLNAGSDRPKINSPVSPLRDFVSPVFNHEEKGCPGHVHSGKESLHVSCQESDPLPDLVQSKSCSLPYVYPEYFGCPATHSYWKSGGLKEHPILLTHSQSGVRAKSEPPLGMEESLYRVKSCPGIAQGKGTEDSKLITQGAGMNFRFPYRFVHGNRSVKRYSCSALDCLPETRPSFESCPDMSKLNPFACDSGPSSAGPSPSSSFHRLLKVS